MGNKVCTIREKQEKRSFLVFREIKKRNDPHQVFGEKAKENAEISLTLQQVLWNNIIPGKEKLATKMFSFACSLSDRDFS